MTSLATFTDRYTMRHVRHYPHPVERVWEAITSDEHISAWMGFRVQFELRVGGRCVWGNPDSSYFETEIIRLEPPNVIEHEGMRFVLTPEGDGCRLDFIQSFAPGQTWEPIAGDLGGDLPGGPDTPWRPGFVGGFHLALDSLGRLLDGEDPQAAPTPKDELFGLLVDEWLKRKVREHELDADVAECYGRELKGVAAWNDLNVAYRKHIRERIPSA